MDYDAGGFRILVQSSNFNFWSTPHRDFEDVRLEVDAAKLAGPDENRIGLLCRQSGAEYYFFMMSSDGYNGIGIMTGGQARLLSSSQMQQSDKILQGMAVNHLRADCTGNELVFYVNGFALASVHDPTLTSGDVGVLAGTFEVPGVDIVFDNFVVLAP
jgi:hypothetical protein